jgi:phosphomannomutase
MNAPEQSVVSSTARAWLAAEPDPDLRSELEALLLGDPQVLAERFSGRLQFGTAGLRAPVGAGPLRMNRLVVRQAAAGFVRYLLEHEPDAAARGVLIGYDARRKSDLFALDTARVAAGMGVRALLVDTPAPTPLISWGLTELGTAGAVVVTASHNPPADNGYKVYLGDGGQIVPPQDAAISDLIGAVDATQVHLAEADDPLIERVGDDLAERYVAHAAGVRLQPDVPGVVVAYTAMHGVGGRLVERAFAAAGLPAPAVVAEQHQPDGSFPTVSFPNPEEPGAMDLVIERARAAGVGVAVANDPDADRLGAAIALRDGSWRRLAGDEIGWLFADHILRHTEPLPRESDDRLVVTTLVSSALLGRMAERHGVHHAETYTGFKWIAKEVIDHPELRFVFGYEQALGYLVTSRPLDKDGISAAVLFAEIVASAAHEGLTLEDRLDAIAAEYGRYVIAERSVRMDPVVAAARVSSLRQHPPERLADLAVIQVRDFPEANLLRLMLGDAASPVRVQVRPSGTEPKVKLYGEAVGRDPAPLLEELAELLGT